MRLFGHEKVFQIISIILATEQSIKSFAFIFLDFYLHFKSTFTIKTFMNEFWNDLSRTASASMFYIAIDYKTKTDMKVAASNKH